MLHPFDTCAKGTPQKTIPLRVYLCMTVLGPYAQVSNGWKSCVPSISAGPLRTLSPSSSSSVKRNKWHEDFSTLAQLCQFISLLSLDPFTAMVSFEKRSIKVRNLIPLRLFVLFLALACERIFIKTRSIENRCVTGPENILFAGASVYLSARKFDRLGQGMG